MLEILTTKIIQLIIQLNLSKLIFLQRRVPHFRVQRVLRLGLGLMSLVGLGLGLDSSLRKDQVSSLKITSPNKYFLSQTAKWS